ncbi:hypothetical protein BOA8489_02648 [Boseongicola aestuarii]|uniref:Uncharacterized protein n=1 Tax=Boseongicola aestuarii TaxID=1470561 RepID=A0A238J2R8_9RHOB|nr:hypothetical protein BOA8489_02648 [Boseongicola aestuarii]
MAAPLPPTPLIMSCAGVSASRLRLCALTGKKRLWKWVFHRQPGLPPIVPTRRLDISRRATIYIRMMQTLKSLSGMVIAAALAAPADAADATLIVDRRAESVALYFKMAATDFEPVFGTGAEGLLGADGTVDVPRLYDGTFPLADKIFAATTVSLAGQATPFEAISMMVHDPDSLPEFVVPYDAELSIAICTSPETVQDMTLETLEGYLGYFAWKVDGLAELVIDLPLTGRSVLELRVRESVDHVEVADQKVSLPDGGKLTLTPPEPPAQGLTAWLTAVSLGFALFAAGMIFLRAPKPRAAT